MNQDPTMPVQPEQPLQPIQPKPAPQPQFTSPQPAVQPQPQPNAFAPISSPPQQKSPMKFILIAIVILAIAAVGVFCVIMLTNGSGKNKSSDGNDGGVTIENGVEVGGQTVELHETYAGDDAENTLNGYGLFKVDDGYIYKGGDSYIEISEDGTTTQNFEQGYLKNVVKFNNNYWRIVKVNSDGSTRLIYYGTMGDDGKIQNSRNMKYHYFKTGTNTLEYEYSALRTELNTELLQDKTLFPANYENYLAKSKWDVSKYSIYHKLAGEKTTSAFEDYVGAISVEEYKNATYCFKFTTKAGYGVTECNNYIANSLGTAETTDQLHTFTTNLTVSDDNTTVTGAQVIERSNGDYNLYNDYDIDESYHTLAVLPVITLKPEIKFASGNGSVENPFVVE